MKKGTVRFIVIYLTGVLLAAYLSFNHMANFKKSIGGKFLKREVVFCSCISLLSWSTVVAVIFLDISDSKYFDEPIN